MFNRRRTKLKYATQISRRPPIFAIFTNNLHLDESGYVRYLTNSLREYFNLQNSMVRIYLRKSDSPYANLPSNKRQVTVICQQHPSKKA